MQRSIKIWTIVGVLALALLLGGGVYAFTSSGLWRHGFGNMMNIGHMGGLGMMGQGQGMGPHMMGGGCPGPWWSYGKQAQGPVDAIDQAIAVAQNYLTSLGNPDLVLAEIMEFTNHFYAVVKEESTGIGAFEILIDRYSGAVHPEPGPNMMWNTKYGHMSGWGHMGGMMGGYIQESTAKMPIGSEEARVYAQGFLDSYMPGLSVADDVDTFYGYYTIHVLGGDQIFGMLSVNGYTGQVWYHSWHGQFLGMRELEEH